MDACEPAEELGPWREELAEHLTAAFGELAEQPLSLLRPPAPVLDDVAKLRVRNSGGQTVAVALCSSREWPEMVADAMEHARRARSALGDDLGAAVLLPEHEGRRDGRSYAVLPFRQPLGTKRLLWPIQRFRVGRGVASWLGAATARTSRPLQTGELETNFRAPLHALSELDGISARIRGAATDALTRLGDHAWSPRHTLMHGDLWEGNVLMSGNGPGFVVIDWAGSRTDGYGIFDLMRWARSMHMSDRKLRTELEIHCEHLACGFEDARSHLLAALAFLGTNLNQFPLAEYSAMAERSLDSLEHAGG